MSIFWTDRKKEEPRQQRLPMTIGFANHDQPEDRFAQAWSYKPDNRELKRARRLDWLVTVYAYTVAIGALIFLLWAAFS